MIFDNCTEFNSLRPPPRHIRDFVIKTVFSGCLEFCFGRWKVFVPNSLFYFYHWIFISYKATLGLQELYDFITCYLEFLKQWFSVLPVASRTSRPPVVAGCSWDNSDGSCDGPSSPRGITNTLFTYLLHDDNGERGLRGPIFDLRQYMTTSRSTLGSRLKDSWESSEKNK